MEVSQTIRNKSTQQSHPRNLTKNGKTLIQMCTPMYCSAIYKNQVTNNLTAPKQMNELGRYGTYTQ